MSSPRTRSVASIDTHEALSEINDGDVVVFSCWPKPDTAGLLHLIPGFGPPPPPRIALADGCNAVIWSWIFQR